MIYKFIDDENGNVFEIQLIENEQPANDVINFNIECYESDKILSVNLHKKDVFRLIGALHMLHKEME